MTGFVWVSVLATIGWVIWVVVSCSRRGVRAGGKTALLGGLTVFLLSIPGCIVLGIGTMDAAARPDAYSSSGMALAMGGAAFSVYWGVVGVVSIIAGFVLRAAGDPVSPP